MTNKIEDTSFQSGLPSYKRPPVNEVVCGMRFQPPENLRIPHIGLLWNKFRANYPKLQHAPPISTAKGELLVDTASGFPLPRVWFINDSDDQLIQFQNDRFYFNWRKRESEYPRYNHIIENFELVFNAIKDFFKEFSLGELTSIENELTYINHIPQNMGWKTIDDLPKVFTDFNWKKSTTRYLQNPSRIDWEAVFSFPEAKSDLVISLKQAIRKEDKLPVFIFQLKAVGINSNNTTRDWFDLAHVWIIQGFTDLTSHKIQKIWEREDNA